jgi:RNA polymerase sigma-70 factor, ECF subfamily
LSADPEPRNPRDQRTREFLRLLSLHDRSTYAMILAMVHSWADADEIAQELRIRLWEQFDKFQTGTDFGAWARQIAYYLVLAHRKKAKRAPLAVDMQFLDSLLEKAAEAEAEETGFLRGARQAALAACLEALDESKRRLVRQYYSGSESIAQLADRLGRPYEALRKALYRTQMALADCIRARLGEK